MGEKVARKITRQFDDGKEMTEETARAAEFIDKAVRPMLHALEFYSGSSALAADPELLNIADNWMMSWY